MSQFSTLKSFFLAGAALTLVAACGDADIASPGEGEFIGAPPGGGGGGDDGVSRDLTFGGCPTGTTASEIPDTNITACQIPLNAQSQLVDDLTLTGTNNPAAAAHILLRQLRRHLHRPGHRTDRRRFGRAGRADGSAGRPDRFQQPVPVPFRFPRLPVGCGRHPKPADRLHLPGRH